MKRYIAVIAVLTLFTVSITTGGTQAGDVGGKAAAQSSQAALHKGAGTVTAVDNAKSRATITHGPIPTLKWPAMNMAFNNNKQNLCFTYRDT